MKRFLVPKTHGRTLDNLIRGNDARIWIWNYRTSAIIRKEDPEEQRVYEQADEGTSANSKPSHRSGDCTGGRREHANIWMEHHHYMIQQRQQSVFAHNQLAGNSSVQEIFNVALNSFLFVDGICYIYYNHCTIIILPIIL